MPILGKQQFEMSVLPEDLPLDTKMWYSDITGEGFLKYDDYFDKQILYSSLFWTCSVTGKSGLTYHDALKSERESKRLLSSVPRILQKVLLHLMKYQNNFSSSVTISCLAEYTNLRYFIGENIQTQNRDQPSKINAIIVDVVPPESLKKSATIAYGVDPLSYHYLVEFSDGSRELLPASRISRPKNLLTKEKIRLFLRQHLAPKNGRYDTLSIKDESLIQFGLDKLEWEDIFKGPLPNFNDDTVMVKTNNRNRSSGESSSMVEANSSSDNSLQISKKKGSILAAQKMKLITRKRKYNKDKQTQMMNHRGKPGPKKENSRLSKTKKEADKNREKASKKHYEKDLKAWHEKRDDLLCDDLKPLPIPIPVDHRIDDSLVGDSLKIIDFLNVYRSYLPFEETFPQWITYSHFTNLLHDNQLPRDGCVDVFVALLRTILNSKQCYIDFEEPYEIELLDDNDFADHDETIDMAADHEKQPDGPDIRTNEYIVKYFSSKEQLAKFDLNYETLQEILRIYIFKTRYHGVTHMKITPEEVAVVKKLTFQNLCDLSPKERILIFNILLNDLINVPFFKEKIDNSMEEMFKLKTEIRHHKARYTKWLRDNPTRQRIRKRKAEDSDENNLVEQDNELTQEEKDQFKREKMEKEEKMNKAIAQLKTKMRKYSAFCRPRPLGMDRFHRKYWIFQSIPGVFVENTIADGHTYPCFEDPQPMAKPKLNDYLSNASRRKNRSTIEGAISQTMDDSKRCTGNPLTCAVHVLKSDADDNNPTKRWSFYQKEQIIDLIDALNSRGARESELKNAFIIEKKAIIDEHFRKFDPQEFNRKINAPNDSHPDEESIFVVRKSGRLLTKKNMMKQEKYTDHSHDFDVKAKMFATEQNIFLGGFSSLAEPARSAWCLGVYKAPYCGDRVESLTLLVRKLYELARSLKPFCLTAPLGVNTVGSTSSSPSEKENKDNNLSPKGNKMAISEKWLDVLRVPESLKTNNTIDFDDPDSSYGITHHSQIYLNIFLLRKSIKWNFSAEITATYCDACHKTATEKMLLCDNCNCGYHYACVRPPLKPGFVVDGDWFCYTCVPRIRDVGRIDRKEVKDSQYDDYNEDQVDEKEVISNNKENIKKNEEASLLDRCHMCKKHIIESFTEVCCKTCNEYFHLSCVNLTRVPRQWNCLACSKREIYEMRHKNREMNIIKANKNYDSEVRRSSRKRKPNYYKYEPDETYSTTIIKRNRYSVGYNNRFEDDDDDDADKDDDGDGEEKDDFDQVNRSHYDSDEEYRCKIFS